MKREILAGVAFVGALAALSSGTATAAPGDVSAARIADIRPGPISSNPQNLFDAGGTLLFAADDGASGNELWRSSGGPLGPGGTEMIELFAGIDGSGPSGFTSIGGTVFFTSSDPTNGAELRRMTPPFTAPALVENIGPAAAPGASTLLSEVGGTLFFVGNDGSSGDELWKTAPPYDPGSTSLVEDINTTSAGASSSPNQSISANGTLLFGADEDGSGTELWRSVPPFDAASTTEIDMGPGASFPFGFQLIDGTVLFSASGGGGDFELWKMAPPYTTPTLVENINPSASSDADDLVKVNDTLFFKADDGAAGEELWESVPPFDAGSTSVLEVKPGPDGSNLNFLEAVGGLLYFRADDGVSGAEPWRSDGGPVGSGTRVLDVVPGSGGSAPLEFEGLNGTAFFRAASAPVASQELWKSDGTSASAVPSAVSAPSDLTDVGDALFFEAIDGAGQELWTATIEGQADPPVTPKGKKCKKKKKRKGKSAAVAKKKKCKKKKGKK